MLRHIKHIVFKSGGVLGIIYAGAWSELSKHIDIKELKGVAGTSAGAAAALMTNLNYSSNDIRQFMFETNFKKFLDKRNFLNIRTKYSIYKGDFLTNWIKHILQFKNIKEDISLIELYELTNIELKVYACNINKVELVEFCYKTYPNLKVADVVRASMSIPLFFEPWQFKEEEMNKDIYIDGGIIYSFPITAFDDLDSTLGLYIDTNEDVLKDDLKFNQIQKYIKHLVKAMMTGQDIDFFKSYRHNQIIKYNSLGMSTTHFSITDEEKNNLYHMAKNQTKEFLKSYKQYTD